MADLIIPSQLAAKLQSIANRENRPVEAVLETMINQYQPKEPEFEDLPPEIQEAMRRLRPKYYERARQYWREAGDQARLALTDAELDEQFWLFDHEGIPRLKADKDQVNLPPDPLVQMALSAWKHNFRSGRTDISANFDEVLEDMLAEEDEHLNE